MFWIESNGVLIRFNGSLCPPQFTQNIPAMSPQQRIPSVMIQREIIGFEGCRPFSLRKQQAPQVDRRKRIVGPQPQCLPVTGFSRLPFFCCAKSLTKINAINRFTRLECNGLFQVDNGCRSIGQCQCHKSCQISDAMMLGVYQQQLACSRVGSSSSTRSQMVKRQLQ